MALRQIGRRGDQLIPEGLEARIQSGRRPARMGEAAGLASQNIYINGSVLGLSKKEIDGRIDEIIDFAEIWEFIDTPVQNYKWTACSVGVN